MPGEADPVVGDAILGEVVGTDFLGSGAATDRRATGGFELGDALLLLEFPQFGTEEIETDVTVALLVALLRGDGDDTGGFVDEADSGRDLVHVLAAMAAGSEELPL